MKNSSKVTMDIRKVKKNQKYYSYHGEKGKEIKMK